VSTLVKVYRVRLRESEQARDFVSVDEIVHVHESSHGGTLGEASRSSLAASRHYLG